MIDRLKEWPEFVNFALRVFFVDDEFVVVHSEIELSVELVVIVGIIWLFLLIRRVIVGRGLSGHD